MRQECCGQRPLPDLEDQGYFKGSAVKIYANSLFSVHTFANDVGISFRLQKSVNLNRK